MYAGMNVTWKPRDPRRQGLSVGSSVLKVQEAGETRLWLRRPCLQTLHLPQGQERERAPGSPARRGRRYLGPDTKELAPSRPCPAAHCLWVALSLSNLVVLTPTPQPGPFLQCPHGHRKQKCQRDPCTPVHENSHHEHIGCPADACQTGSWRCRVGGPGHKQQLGHL